MATRKIIQIDEEKCDGCGLCVPACAEGAIQIIEGKARLVSDKYCDGLGDCLGDCPQGALTIVEREAENFDEAAVEAKLSKQPTMLPLAPSQGGGCPSARLMSFGPKPAAPAPKTTSSAASRSSGLEHWPVKLQLVPPTAPFLKDADVLLAADCAGFSFAGLHEDLLPGRAVIIGCPKFDDPTASFSRLRAIFAQGGLRSLTVVHMEVPCCHAYLRLAEQALAASGQEIPFYRIQISLKGDIQFDDRPEANKAQATS
ncbi:MAG: 4Fe-4S binding protein [Deltaproteobacteria bacterium]|nr:4Fe-4S binding protein [Deltaproteobacteria bacterium]